MIAFLRAEWQGQFASVGIFGMTPDTVAPYEDRGFDWLLVGIDRPA